MGEKIITITITIFLSQIFNYNYNYALEIKWNYNYNLNIQLQFQLQLHLFEEFYFGFFLSSNVNIWSVHYTLKDQLLKYFVWQATLSQQQFYTLGFPF